MPKFTIACLLEAAAAAAAGAAADARAEMPRSRLEFSQAGDDVTGAGLLKGTDAVDWFLRGRLRRRGNYAL